MITRESSYNSILEEGSKTLNSDSLKGNTKKEDIHPTNFYRAEAGSCIISGEDNRDKSIPFELYKRRTSIVVKRKCFLDVVCQALDEYKYVGPSERADLILACRYRATSYTCQKVCNYTWHIINCLHQESTHIPFIFHHFLVISFCFTGSLENGNSHIVIYLISHDKFSFNISRDRQFKYYFLYGGLFNSLPLFSFH